MTLPQAKGIVFTAKPKLALLYKNYQHKTWLEYAKDNYPKKREIMIKPDFLKSFQKVLLPLLGKRKTASAMHTLKKTGFVSTADHHGILCHPFFSNNTLLRTHPDLIKENESIISVTCGGVSVSNSSYPRGIFFHDTELREVRMPFLSLYTKHLPLFGHAPILQKKINQNIEKISNLDISKKAKRKLHDFLKLILNTKKIWQVPFYSDQATIINDILWENLFGDSRGTLVYIQGESLMRQLLLDTHLDTNTTINRILFDKTYRNSYLKQFENIIGAHDTKNKKGTHLFWYIDTKERKRKQLWLKNNQLITGDGKIQILLNPDSIRKELSEYKIFPSMAFCYSTFAFYYGLTLGGGFSQIQYLDDMKKAFQKMCEECNDTCADSRTDIFTGEYVALGVHNEQTSVPASLLDILLWSDNNRNSIINTAFQKLTVGQCLELMMPEFVQIITGNRPVLKGISKPHSTFNVNN